jgi:hypothetical protein
LFNLSLARFGKEFRVFFPRNNFQRDRGRIVALFFDKKKKQGPKEKGWNIRSANQIPVDIFDGLLSFIPPAIR